MNSNIVWVGFKLFLLFILLNIAGSFVASEEIARPLCDPDCAAVLCMRVDPWDCKSDERFVQADLSKCICCNYCEKKKPNTKPPCDPDCALVDCMRVDPSDCKSDERFVQADLSKCICCSYCEKKKPKRQCQYRYT